MLTQQLSNDPNSEDHLNVYMCMWLEHSITIHLKYKNGDNEAQNSFSATYAVIALRLKNSAKKKKYTKMEMQSNQPQYFFRHRS